MTRRARSDAQRPGQGQERQRHGQHVRVQVAVQEGEERELGDLIARARAGSRGLDSSTSRPRVRQHLPAGRACATPCTTQMRRWTMLAGSMIAAGGGHLLQAR